MLRILSVSSRALPPALLALLLSIPAFVPAQDTRPPSHPQRRLLPTRRQI